MSSAAFSVQKYTSGTRLVLRLTDSSNSPVDLGAARSMKIALRDPSGRSSSEDAELVGDGRDGKLFRLIHRGELNQEGLWEMQAHVRLPLTSTVIPLW